MLQRTREPNNHELQESYPLLVGDLMNILEEIEMQDWREEIEKALDRAQQNRIRAEQRREAMKGLVPAPAGPPDALGVGLPKPRKKAIEWPAGGCSQAMAKAWLPPNASVSKETTWHHRWKAKASYLGHSSRSFNPAEAGADNRALQHVLRVVWKAWIGDTDRVCPWAIGGGSSASALVRARLRV